MKYVRQFGSIWELPEQKFKEFLEAGAKVKSYNLNDYGRMILDKDDAELWITTQPKKIIARLLNKTIILSMGPKGI